MLVRSLMVLCMAGSLAVAGEPETNALRPPDLSKLSGQQFQQLLSKAIAGAPAMQIARLSVPKPLSAVCSIPLLKFKIDHPERFNMPRLALGSRKIDPMTVPNPAPECTDR